MSVEAEEVFFASLLDAVGRPFRHEAENRHLSFEVQSDPHLARSVVTDSKRLQQVLKNLLSNAFKFTEVGGVRMSVSLARSGWSEDHPILGKAASVVAFEVSDTGIGIPFEKQRIIFEAFQQADAGTSRKYGGTGLGLAISRELASLLGGEIQLRSAPGRGSTFTLYLPQTYVGPSTSNAALMEQRSATTVSPVQLAVAGMSEHAVEKIEDDRDNLQPDDAILLIVEDDAHYARVLCDLSRDKGFKVLVATSWCGSARARPRVSSDGSIARCVPARHAGLDGAQSLEAGSGNSAHSSADADPRRRSPSWLGARGVCFCDQANDA